MNRILIIARKEFKDLVTDRIILLSFAALLVTMCASAYYQVDWLNHFTAMSETLGEWKCPHPYQSFPYMNTSRISGQLSTLGALVAVAISFNSINRERADGSLKVLLSYPVYRDQVLLGKLLAGSILLTLITFASTGLAFTITAVYASIPFTVDNLLRFLSVAAMGTVLLLFFLCLGMASSIHFKDTTTNLLSLLLIIAVFRSETIIVLLLSFGNVAERLGFNLQGGVLPAFFMDWNCVVDHPFARNFGRISPIETFRQFAYGMFIYTWWKYPLDNFQELFLRNLDLVAVQIVFLVFGFVANYILFTRSEVT